MTSKPITIRDHNALSFSHSAKYGKQMPRIITFLCACVLGIIIFFGFATDNAKATKKTETAFMESETAHSPSLPLETTSTPIEPAQSKTETPKFNSDIKSITIKSGDTVSKVFDAHNISALDLHNIMALGKKTSALKRIQPGDKLILEFDKNKLLKGLRYEISKTDTLIVQQEENRFTAKTLHNPLDVQTNFRRNTIKNSLFLAAKDVNLSDNIVMKLSEIFGWDIDFALDIREGDSFSVLYEELYRNGEKVKDGAILAAEFTNRNKTFQAIRYKDNNGHVDYYNPKGYSMRKEFLRTPVDFARISSRFNLKRKHPVLNRIRAHKGVDYAASKGTPIKATSNGKVTFKGTKGGYGNTVILQHGQKYSTLYAHMSRFAKGVRNGKRVRQGQTIGYVGSSGLATGPHLHYEFRVNGVHRNPLKVKLPNAAPINSKYKSDFKKHAKQMLAMVERYKDTQIALLQ